MCRNRRSAVCRPRRLGGRQVVERSKEADVSRIEDVRTAALRRSLGELTKQRPENWCEIGGLHAGIVREPHGFGRSRNVRTAAATAPIGAPMTAPIRPGSSQPQGATWFSRNAPAYA